MLIVRMAILHSRQFLINLPCNQPGCIQLKRLPVFRLKTRNTGNRRCRPAGKNL